MSETIKENIKTVKILPEIRQKVRKFEGLGCWLIYLFDTQGKNARLKQLRSVPPIIDWTDTQETFILSEPAFYIEGVPVFILLRECISSIVFDLTQFDDEFETISQQAMLLGYSDEEVREMKERQRDLTLRLPTPTELYHKTRSGYFLRIFKKNEISWQSVLITSLISALLSLLTYTVTNMYWIHKTSNWIVPSG